MADAPPTPRALGRATLARQMLLARRETKAERAIEQLVALQAQAARAPFVALWSRVKGFRREELAALLAKRRVVRATSMRGTLHLLSAKDFARMRGALQPSLTQAMSGILKARGKGLDLDRLAAEARAFFGEKPRTFVAVRDHLVKRIAGGDERAMGYAVRMHLPLVQVPTADDAWSFPASPDFALADAWMGAEVQPAGPEAAQAIVLRYLAALGPASAADVESWTGMKKEARDVLEALRPKLVVLKAARGRELFDLPDAPRPPEDAPAPPRLLPEFDNVLLGHADRTRFIDAAHRSQVYLPGLRVAPTFLVDGRVAGTWGIERPRERDPAALTLAPFGKLAARDRDALEEEAAALVRFVEPDAPGHDVRFAGGRGAAKRAR